MRGLYRKYFAHIRQPVSDREIARGQLNTEQQVKRIREHLARRHTSGQLRLLRQQPRTLIAVRNVNWEQAGLVDFWQPLTDVVHCDWGWHYEQVNLDWFSEGRPRFGRELLAGAVAGTVRYRALTLVSLARHERFCGTPSERRHCAKTAKSSLRPVCQS